MVILINIVAAKKGDSETPLASTSELKRDTASIWIKNDVTPRKTIELLRGMVYDVTCRHGEHFDPDDLDNWTGQVYFFIVRNIDEVTLAKVLALVSHPWTFAGHEEETYQSRIPRNRTRC